MFTTSLANEVIDFYGIVKNCLHFYAENDYALLIEKDNCMRYEKKSIPPPRLVPLIAAFNKLPPDDEVRKIIEPINKSFHLEQQAAMKEERYEDLPKIDEKHIKRLQNAFKPEAIAPAVQAAGFMNAKFQIDLLMMERRVLRQIVNAYNDHRYQTFYMEDQAVLPIMFDADGTIRPAGVIFGIFSKTAPDRIRICEICKSFFWAKRSNAWSCSPECSNQLANLVRQGKVIRRKEPEVW